jgi:predicted permease
MTLTGALTTAILPVLSITAVGFVLGRFVDVEVRPLSVVTVYVLAPALVFDSMVTTELEGSQIGALAAGVGVVTVAMVIVGEAAAWLDGTEGASRNGLVLASTFSNCGNFGIPLSAFAFGAVGRSTAVLYLVAQNVLMYTLGVYLAARGDRRSALPGDTEVSRLPLVNAHAAGLLGRLSGVFPPPPNSAAMEMVSLTGNAAIPVMLLLLGLQLARTDYGATVRRMALPNVLRLAVAPVIATAVALTIGFADATVARVFVLESSMPVVITPLMLAIEYDGTDAGVSAPEYLGTAIFTSTLLLIPTTALLLTVLRSGAVV